MINGPFSPWPSFSETEANAVRDVLLSNKVNYWTGDECRKFEREFASFAGCKHAVAVANGTVALDLALRAINVLKGDEIIVTSRTFLASVSCIINSGATPIFADVNRDSQNIDIHSVKAVLTARTRAIVCVHLAGWPCDMDPIVALAKEIGLHVIEDCAQAHGGVYKGRSVGSIGDIGCWSFCQDKIMTTGGEGGMVTTNNSALWSKMWSFKDHGKSWKAVYETSPPSGFQWLHETFGTNWRMTEMQAAIGRLQLKYMPEWHKTRSLYAKQILETARMLPNIRVPKLSCEGCSGICQPRKACAHAFYKCYVFINGSEQDQKAIISKIIEKGVPCFPGSCSEVYLEKAFDKTGLRPDERLPTARELGDTSLMFLCHPTLKQEEVDLTCKVLTEVVTGHQFYK
jgi:dTDP-4-amino-4,6-dideoxygalactose transaminase